MSEPKSTTGAPVARRERARQHYLLRDIARCSGGG